MFSFKSNGDPTILGLTFSLCRYFCVAFVAHRRNRGPLLETAPLMRNLHCKLTALPTTLMKEEAEGVSLMVTIEEVIASAISIMYVWLSEMIAYRSSHSYIRVRSRVPPKKLLKSVRSVASLSKSAQMIPIVAMLQDPAPWSVAGSAPTDWALLQRAKTLRSAATRDLAVPIQETSSDNHSCSDDYPLAKIAAGVQDDNVSFGRRALLSILLLVLIVAAICGAGAHVDTDRVLVPPMNLLHRSWKMGSEWCSVYPKNVFESMKKPKHVVSPIRKKPLHTRLLHVVTRQGSRSSSLNSSDVKGKVRLIKPLERPKTTTNAIAQVTDIKRSKGPLAPVRHVAKHVVKVPRNVRKVFSSAGSRLRRIVRRKARIKH